ncbi:DUF1616 domain-containing protein [Halarchaeum nitratireducens]|uniref:DUF1616 domain-containing protein n=1 Tax=Halarchaeum nitratireducens TaxID=489913 RepID=A0A830G7N0_9EURY|nr:DUF1616 domain-containing protein [Halarchaeum nitratireducens]GGN09799.1 hypothetical protein GCM10009021_06780 [Halarchaeum nitratireducens]
MPPRAAPRVPRDLSAAIGLTLLADACVLLSPLGGALRLPLGLALALLAPGYAIVAALFADDERPGATRLALAVAASAVVTPLCAVGVSLSPFALGPVPLAGALTAVTCLAVVVAARRRSADSAPSESGAPPGTAVASPDATDDRSRRTLDAALVVLILLAAASVAHAALTPATAGASLSLTTGDGGAVAGGYPGENETLSVGVTNHGTGTATYTLVVQRQRVAAENATRVLARDEVRRETLTVPAGETRRRSSAVADGPGRTRVVYLLYDGGVPTTPTASNADRETHVWID